MWHTRLAWGHSGQLQRRPASGIGQKRCSRRRPSHRVSPVRSPAREEDRCRVGGRVCARRRSRVVFVEDDIHEVRVGINLVPVSRGVGVRRRHVFVERIRLVFSAAVVRVGDRDGFQLPRGRTAPIYLFIYFCARSIRYDAPARDGKTARQATGTIHGDRQGRDTAVTPTPTVEHPFLSHQEAMERHVGLRQATQRRRQRHASLP